MKLLILEIVFDTINTIQILHASFLIFVRIYLY